MSKQSEELEQELEGEYTMGEVEEEGCSCLTSSARS
jgi:hypothetical protein